MTGTQLVDLSHVITDGMLTYPGLPTPTISDHLTREAAEKVYGPGITFQIGIVSMCTNTGTYLDVPFHRFADGHDLTGLALERVAGVPAVCLDRSVAVRAGERSIELDPSDLDGLAGHAVLVRTDHSRTWGTDAYFTSHPFLAESTAQALVAADVACVGIDSLNIDTTDGGERPVHTALLRAGIPIIEHLTNLDRLPASNFRFTAVPPKIEGAGTFTVRAFAGVPVQ
jgi:arylformamidase